MSRLRPARLLTCAFNSLLLSNCVELPFRTALSAAMPASRVLRVPTFIVEGSTVQSSSFDFLTINFLRSVNKLSSSTAPPSDLLNFALGLAISFSTDDGGPYGDAAKEYFAAQANRDQSSQFHGRLPPSSKSGFSADLSSALTPQGST